MKCIKRFLDMQDKNQLINAGKYFVSLLVAVFSAAYGANKNFLAVWIVFAIINTLYTYSWDIHWDFKLHPIRLREQLLYPKWVSFK